MINFRDFAKRKKILINFRDFAKGRNTKIIYFLLRETKVISDHESPADSLLRGDLTVLL